MLSRQTLVLSRNWQPVGMASLARSLARSLALLAAERARIVDPADFQQYTWADWVRLIPQEDKFFFRSLTFQMRVPEVIALSEYGRVPANSVTFSRRNIYMQDRFASQNCGVQPGSEELTLGHVLLRVEENARCPVL